MALDYLIPRIILTIFIFASILGLSYYYVSVKKRLELKKLLIILLILWFLLKLISYAFKDWILASLTLSLLFALIMGFIIFLILKFKNK